MDAIEGDQGAVMVISVCRVSLCGVLAMLLYNTNVCSVKKYTKRSSNTVLRLVYFFMEQTLGLID